MKNIKIDSRTFEYDINKFQCGEYGAFTGYETLFYYGFNEVIERKYMFFGEKQIVKVPKFVFKINYNIEDPKYSKEKIKEYIQKELTIFDRQTEINNGIII